jgi:hypothetical protein
MSGVKNHWSDDCLSKCSGKANSMLEEGGRGANANPSSSSFKDNLKNNLA